MALLLFFPVALGILGLILPPPERRPVGIFYGLVHLLDLLFVGACVFLLFEMGLYGKPSPLFHRIAAWSVLAFVVLALEANTLWGLQQAKRVPEEGKREAFRRIARRLWIPLVALPLLPVLLVVLFAY